MEETEGKTLTEGKATVIYEEKHVFYNPIQEFNRDLSILMIKMYNEQLKIEAEQNGKSHPGIDILEALSATGLRSIRYWKEIPNINKIIVNDLEPTAVETIKKNLEFNNIDITKCIPNQGDCNDVMYGVRNATKKFDVVDLDPYGTASPFLDAAVQALNHGGLLCVTCTDLAVLCASHPETCYAKYQAIPLKGEHCHETALRIVLNNIQSHAVRYKKTIEPLVSIYVDFYVRLFVRVYDNPHATKSAFSRSGMLYQCGGCKTFWPSRFGEVTQDNKGNSKYKMTIGPTVPPKCEFCGSTVKMGGPLWLDPMHNVPWVKRALQHLEQEETKSMYKSHKRIKGLLSICAEELPGSPLYYNHSALCNIARLETPSLIVFRSAVLSTGHKVSASHCVPNAIKTNAPNTVIWDIIRAWNKLHPAKLANLHPESPGRKILSVEPVITVDFKERSDAKFDSGKIPRFIKTPGGGPKARAKGKRSRNSEDGNTPAPTERAARKRKTNSTTTNPSPLPPPTTEITPMEPQPNPPEDQNQQ
uniref:tRNA (guanine(26)-N(2))-dimethyltransferase n=1 Tax=Arcella intermedia TaxID=1963864 RepID=A0A6B2L1K9_9EUKA|eukprot:TRINITY_DN1017_c0_g1_i2.p1 TRINITY_DN1017_c0_g1~~TRINITY_DN1017_c0_g1_i2.p1  ORF type:complete len:541 (+),score=102.07 TRINITY_DN1017_c0_g1_i2:31-1623(+)